MSKNIGKDKRACQTERNREDNRKRQYITFVLSTQNQIDKYKTKNKYQCRTITRFLFRTSQTREFVPIAVRQCLLGNLIHCLDGITCTISISRRSIDSDRRKQVETVNIRRAIYLIQGNVLVYRSHSRRRTNIDGI